MRRYNDLTYEHPKLVTFTPSGLAARVAKHGKYDLIVTMSSLDHDGLGRYGDPMAPDGDLLTLDSLASVISPSGLCFLTVPVGPDAIVWNLHRRYGPIRLPLLLEGGPWRVKKQFGFQKSLLTREADWRKTYEPVHVLSLDGSSGEL